MKESLQPADIQPATKWAEENPNLFPKPTTLPYILRNRDTNGLAESGAYIMIGHTGHIVVPKWMAWAASKVA